MTKELFQMKEKKLRKQKKIIYQIKSLKHNQQECYLNLGKEEMNTVRILVKN